MPGIRGNATYCLIVDGINSLEMNVAYGVTVVDTVMEENEAYGAAIDGTGIDTMRRNIAYCTGAVTTHEDSAGYTIIR